MEEKQKNFKFGFTLLELLVVVLIIGILTAIALPQYKMAVTKAKVASILPIMRRWKDALQEYKLQHGSYQDLDWETGGATLGVSWPSDWKVGNGDPCGDNIDCHNDYWHCAANEEGTGFVSCNHIISEDNNVTFTIMMYQQDEPNYEGVAGLITCEADGGGEAEKVCKALGGKLLEDAAGYASTVYKLN